MPKFFINNSQIYENKITIIGEDVNHIANVLRKQIGDTLNICNISTSDNFLCQIDSFQKDNIQCTIVKKIDSSIEPETKITVFQGLPKAEKMEFIIQKCTEIGVTDFYPVNMERCIVKLDDKKSDKKLARWQKIAEVAAKQSDKKLARWQKIAEVAAKQSGRDIIPQIKNLINLKKLCNLIAKYDIVLLAYENEENYSLKDALKSLKNTHNLKIGIIIGPEGGLDKKEVDELKTSGAVVVTLGKRILRTETVGIAVSSIILYEFN